MNKKIIIVIFVVTLVLIFFYLIRVPTVIQSPIAARTQQNQKSDFKINQNKAKKIINKSQTKTQTAMVFSSEEVDTLDVEQWPGYGKELSDKLNSKDPRVMPSIDDYPIDRQKQLREQLELETKLGYTPVEQEEFINREIDIKSNLFSAGNADDNANFELSQLPDDLSNGYLGFVMEDALPGNNTNFKSNAIRRVFEVDGVVISLEEVSAQNGTGHFIKEFVTDYIGEYPAVMGTMKKDNKQFEQLIWDTDLYRYALYGYSTKPTSEVRAQLLKISHQITDLNKD